MSVRCRDVRVWLVKGSKCAVIQVYLDRTHPDGVSVQPPHCFETQFGSEAMSKPLTIVLMFSASGRIGEHFRMGFGEASIGHKVRKDKGRPPQPS